MKLQFIINSPPPFFFLGKELGSSTFSVHVKRALAPKFTFPREGFDVGKRFSRTEEKIIKDGLHF